MGPPTLWQYARQILGRAFRETGQALDRVGVKAAMLAVTPHHYYDDPVIYEDHLSRHRHLFPLLQSGRPLISSEAAYLAPCSTLIGSVVVGKGSSIWYGAVIRGDYGLNAESFRKVYDVEDPENGQPLEPWALDEHRFKHRMDHHGGGVFIGEDTNVQDGCVITARSEHTVIGDGVTIGHLAQLHSCRVGSFALIGMGSVVNAGCVIEDEAFVAAGAVLPQNTVVHAGELWVGNPARKVRDLTAEQRQKLHYQSSEYVTVATQHQAVQALGGNVDENGASVILLVNEEVPEIEEGATVEDDLRIEAGRGDATDGVVVQEEPPVNHHIIEQKRTGETPDIQLNAAVGNQRQQEQEKADEPEVTLKQASSSR